MPHRSAQRLKFLIIFVFVGIFLFFLYENNLFSKESHPDKESSSSLQGYTPSQTGEQHVLNPQYHGMDAQDQPYVIRASKAVKSGEQSYIHLEKVEAFLHHTQSNPMHLTADKANISLDQGRTSFLFGPVKFNIPGMLAMQTQETQIDLNNNTIKMPKHVEGQSCYGKLQADAIQYDMKREKLNLQGRVVLNLAV